MRRSVVVRHQEDYPNNEPGGNDLLLNVVVKEGWDTEEGMYMAGGD